MPERAWCDPVAVIIINPNSTEAMTASMLAAARAAAPSLTFEGWTSHDGPPAIQGAEDGAAATEPLLALVRKADAQGAEGIIIGCFDDTALAEAARTARCPVVGIGQAAYHYCALRQWRFSVVTTLAVSVPVLEDNISAYGLAGGLGRVRASDVPVLELEHSSDAAVAPILHEAREAVLKDGIDAIVLGCAGMVNVTEALRRSLDVAVVDPVSAAAGCLEWLMSGRGH